MARKFVKHAWFSKKHERINGSLEMDTPDGRVVRITALGDQKDCLYVWDDAAYIGLVLDGTFRNQKHESDFNPEPTKPVKPILSLGQICGVCGGEYKERMLLRSTYVGCLC